MRSSSPATMESTVTFGSSRRSTEVFSVTPAAAQSRGVSARAFPGVAAAPREIDAYLYMLDRKSVV